MEKLAEELRFINVYDNALINSDMKRLETASFDFSNLILKYDYVPSILFKWFIELFEKDAFLNSEGSPSIVFLLIDSWDYFKYKQKYKLLNVLGDSYPKFVAKLSYFYISLILGELYCNKQSYLILKKLKNTSNEIARAYIPHGFEHIVTDSENKKLAIVALKELLQMLDDNSNIVITEVREAIKNIKVSLDEGTKRYFNEELKLILENGF